ncbi:hypothetical protein [uncultured Akkermansia sp.]|uniref:hypothetical protein n=1 Tax=uncultured Akkermansia sp. TaxID=512294 RepID=UPI002636C8DF|nr:hypothetical protein [uncultured Akkermansia sp.]
MEKHFYGFIIRVQALILKKSDLRKKLTVQGYPVSAENMKFQTRKGKFFHVYMLSRRPENPCSWGFAVFRIIADTPFYLKNEFFENILLGEMNADNKSAVHY